jgi:hypothetical protein
MSKECSLPLPLVLSTIRLIKSCASGSRCTKICSKSSADIRLGVKTDTRECCIATINCDDYCICPFSNL